MHDSREAEPGRLFEDVRQLLLVVQEVLLNVLPGLKGLGFALFLLHKILPDVLEVLGLHDAQSAAGLLQLLQSRLDRSQGNGEHWADVVGPRRWDSMHCFPLQLGDRS